jgi:hypothetical protein
MNRTQYVLQLRAELIRKLTVVKPIIDETFGTDSYTTFEAKALSAYDQFSDTIPLLNDKNNQANFSFGPFMLAAYQTMTNYFSCTNERALEIMKKMVECLSRHQIERMNPALKFAFSKVGKYSFLRMVMEGYFKYHPEPMGWNANILKEKGAYVAADMTACGLHQWLSLNNAPQLCAVACASDYITMEYLPYLELQREKTIAGGDPICSFRYIRKG